MTTNERSVRCEACSAPIYGDEADSQLMKQLSAKERGAIHTIRCAECQLWRLSELCMNTQPYNSLKEPVRPKRHRNTSMALILAFGIGAICALAIAHAIGRLII